MQFVPARCLFTIFFLLLLVSGTARAHYLWINVHDYAPKEPNTPKFTVGWGHAFYNPVGDILTDKSLLGNFYMLDPTGAHIEIKPLNEFQYQAAQPLTQGTYLAMVQRKEGFSTKTLDGYKRQSKKGLENVVHSRHIGMYGKAIITVGAVTASPNLLQPVGDLLEIVPLVNPASLKAGDFFRFTLLYQGQPLAESVNATYAGFSQDDVWAYVCRTDKEGVGEVRILHPGVWVIKVNHKAPYPDPEEADEYSLTTSLTFAVR